MIIVTDDWKCLNCGTDNPSFNDRTVSSLVFLLVGSMSVTCEECKHPLIIDQREAKGDGDAVVETLA